MPSWLYRCNAGHEQVRDGGARETIHCPKCSTRAYEPAWFAGEYSSPVYKPYWRRSWAWYQRLGWAILDRMMKYKRPEHFND